MLASCVMAGSRRARERSEKSRQNCQKMLKKREREQNLKNQLLKNKIAYQSTSQTCQTPIYSAQPIPNEYVWHNGKIFEKNQLLNMLENQQREYEDLVQQIIDNLQDQQMEDLCNEDDEYESDFNDEKESVSCCYTNQKVNQNQCQDLDDVYIQGDDELMEFQQQQQNRQNFGDEDDDYSSSGDSEFLTEIQDQDSLFDENDSQGSTQNTSNQQNNNNIINSNTEIQMINNNNINFNLVNNTVEDILDNDVSEGIPQKIQISQYNNQCIQK